MPSEKDPVNAIPSQRNACRYRQMSTSPEEQNGFGFSTTDAEAAWSPASDSRGWLYAEEINIDFRWRNQKDRK